MVSTQYLPLWFAWKFDFKMLLPWPSLWWHFIFFPLSSFSTHSTHWNFNWLCWALVPSIIKTHQSDKPILDVKTKFIRYGLWAAREHSVGLHVNSVEKKLQLLTMLLLLCSEKFGCGSFMGFWHLDYSFSRWDWKTCTKFIFNREL